MTKYLNDLQYHPMFTRPSNCFSEKDLIISWEWKVLHTLNIHNPFN